VSLILSLSVRTDPFAGIVTPRTDPQREAERIRMALRRASKGMDDLNNHLSNLGHAVTSKRYGSDIERMQEFMIDGEPVVRTLAKDFETTQWMVARITGKTHDDAATTF
jgi:hypothetical protein